MDITFDNKELEKYAHNDRLGQRKLDPARIRKYKQRLDQLKASATLEDVRHQPGRFHELTSDKKGQCACDLDQPYRLIFQPQEKPIPTNIDAQCLWIKITGVEILKIEDYH